MTADLRDAQSDAEPLTDSPGNKRTTTATATKTDTVTATSHHEMTTTRISTTTATSHHEMTDIRTVTMTPYPSTSGLAAAATPAPALLSAASDGVPIAAIAVPIALAALVALLILPCCIRRFMPRVWSRLDRILPVEHVYSGVAAVWARLKLTRQRNRELRARAASGPAGPMLTGDGRGSGSRWSEKEDEGLEAGRELLGMLGRWRQRQEEKLREVDARRAREERWGLRPGPCGVGGAGARSFEDVRRDELRKAREEKGAGNGVVGL